MGSVSYAQKSQPDPRLSQRFSETQISNMNESRLAYWTFYLENSFIVMDIPTEKASALSNLETIDFASADFHGFSMNLDAYQAEGAYLKFKGENKMVQIKPMKQLLEEFNTYYQAIKQ
jgi:hypothetical protein